MATPSLKTSLLTLGILTIPIFAYLIWSFTTSPATLSTLPEDYTKAGQGVKEDLELLPALPITETETTYEVKDTKEGIDIQFANATEETLKTEETPKLTLAFPKDYAEPIQVKLDSGRVITITDLSGNDGYTSDTLQTESLPREEQGFFARLFDTEDNTAPSQYLRYTSDDERKSLLYAFQKDQATGEKQLKHWTLYASGTGLETEEYKIENAKVKIADGKAEVFYFGEKDIQNEAVKAEVDSNLLERAQRTLAKEMGEDILNGSQSPDFVIPEPYYLDKTGERHTAEWKWNEETKTLSVTLTPSVEQYPIALDPTLSFTAPGVSTGGSVITGVGSESIGGQWGLITGDLNSDGRTDLVAGATAYSSNTGRAYIFYGDSALPSQSEAADIIITGNATSDRFGSSFAIGDFNADGRSDLAVGANTYSSSTGRAYIFYNDGSIPTTAATADVTITGEASSLFARSMESGDFNADGRIDLVITGEAYSTSTGRVYIFYNDGSIPTAATSADVTITGGATSNRFGYHLDAGDFNSDGTTDLVIGAPQYSSSTGRAYIFHNDGSIPTTAGTADVTITGDGGFFGSTITSGDMNADGRIDIVISATEYSSVQGRAYIFHNDGSIPTAATSADVTITGEAGTTSFAWSLATGDFNADGRTDLAVGAYRFAGKTYIFYNDGSIPTTGQSADVIISSEASNDRFGYALTVGDMNADGKTDLIASALTFSSSAGRLYIFYSQNGQVNTNVTITGNATGDHFGHRFTAGDLNADGRTDLVVGAYAYSSNTGRAYIFYNDGTYPTGASSADVTITGNAAGDYFGNSLTVGDFNGDARTDLVVGAQYYSSSTGRAYIFYNDGSIPTTAATADLTITGEASSEFGNSFAVGDLNADGQPDLIVGARQYGSSTGRVYIFHNDGSIPTTAATANVTITGDYGYFGGSLAVGDFNSDGETDLAVGENAADGYRGAAYLFYNDGSIPTTAATADLKIAGTTNISEFASTMVSGDFNADNRVDLAVGAWYEANGAVYLFYNDGSIPTTAATADTIITGEPSSGGSFSLGLNAGDFNADGRTDLVVGAYGRTHPDGGSEAGRAYIFYNDGAYPATATNADLFLATGESGGNHLGLTFGVGDFNADGRTDIAVGANRYSSDTGRVYIYETRENFAWEIQRQPQASTTSSFRAGLNTSGQELKITGETSSKFGYAMNSGDFNSDGKTDLIVGAQNYGSNVGRLYVFYSDGSLAASAINADIVITGESNAFYFGNAIGVGDFNADGRTDFATGVWGYNVPNRAYIFYNDGSIPTTAATADVIIAAGDFDNFATEFAAGDLNADGKTDLIIGSSQNGDLTGKVHIFYNDGSYPSLASSADAIITGQAIPNYFGSGLATGDFNADGRTDLAVGAPGYSTGGRGYLFYSGAITTENASGADVIIEAPSSGDSFGRKAIAGDFNRDGKTDVAFSATTGGGAADGGEINIFYNDGSYPAAASSDDLTISSSTTGAFFGTTLLAADVNSDGWTDIIATGDESLNGASIFYNDGSFPTDQASADVIITGENSSDYSGRSFAVGDFSGDGKNDLAVGADLYSSDRGRVYVYTFNDPVITGNATSDQFGHALATGDLNADGRTDLVVGGYGYSSNTGRAYIFYNDGAIPSGASLADVTITGNATGDNFGGTLAVGDLNADGRTDLIVGGSGYSSGTGRAYIFYNGSITTEGASGADVTITGEGTSNSFGSTLTTGDLNADGKTDLIAGAPGASSGSGRAYIFYNDGSIPTAAGSADVYITGDVAASFADNMVTGDFNADGKTDLVVAMSGYFGFGRLYFFYADGTNNFGTASCSGSSPTTCAAANADQLIIGTVNSDSFGYRVIAGDFNSDGRTDIAATALGYSSSTGRVYIIHNDGSYPSDTSGADVTITGEASLQTFGSSLGAGDFNADGRTDIAVGAYGYPADTYVGKAYIYLNDGSIPTTVATADMVISGEAPSRFGHALATGDVNADGKTDLVVGGYSYSSNTGRVYVFTSEAAPTSAVPGVMKVKGTSSLKGNVRWK